MRSAKFILAILLFFHSHILFVPRYHRLCIQSAWGVHSFLFLPFLIYPPVRGLITPPSLQPPFSLGRSGPLSFASPQVRFTCLCLLPLPPSILTPRFVAVDTSTSRAIIQYIV